MSNKFLPQPFNDFLCLFLVLIIAVLWILAGVGFLQLSPEVMGALIVTWTLLIQFYFRKKSTAGPPQD